MAKKIIGSRVNQILGSEYPLIVGTMLGWSNAEFVAAAANAGAFASIASSMYSTAQALREEIRRARGLTSKPFGVNINLFPALKPQNVIEYVDTAIEEGVGVIETAGRSPEELVSRIKNGKAKLMHKCARLRDARKAENIGADIVEIVGFECGGHPSREGIGGLVLIPQVVDAVKIPVVAGGGIADARGFVAALALGAEGVLMGTRFLACRECQVHPNLKSRLVDTASTESTLVLGSLGDPMRVLRCAPSWLRRSSS
jgi:nitronate monooxygenase